MAKQSGLGDNFYIGGFDLSGDTNSLSAISQPLAALEFTGIDKSAMERQGGIRDGNMQWTSFMNPATAQAHPTLSALPKGDVLTSYFRGTAIGNQAACMVGKQLNYDPNRGDDGALTIGVQASANAYGLDWGIQLTAGKRTDTAATNGSSFDTAASASFGWQAYLHVFSFTGTDVTVKLQDSADNSNWTDITGAAFTQITAAPTSQRLQSSSATATVRRYVRAVTVTTGGVTSVTFAVVLTKNQATRRL
jgi:hypothetical protein